MKPRLLPEIETRFPDLVLKTIYGFIPHEPKKKKTPPASPGLERELKKIQRSPKMTAMGMYGLEDFLLD
jgi:hypothetical protein